MHKATATLQEHAAVETASAIGKALREAIVTMLAALATLACAIAIEPEPGPAVLAVVLTISLSRSHLDRDLRGRLEAAMVLPIVGLVAIGVGTLLLRAPWVGAAVFVTGMFLSIWLRRFGVRAGRAGSLLALPFVAILVTPYVPMRHASALMTVLMPVVVALLALFWVTVCHLLARYMGFLAPARAGAMTTSAAAPTNSLRPPASTRMAIQMAVALAAAFLIGYAFFAERWAWIVLTAFIVNAGNRGRLDVAYKSLLRIAGAAIGTIAGLAFARHIGSHDTTTAGLILTAIFLGIWLRPLGYAWWALFVTMALALLQGFEGAPAADILSLRLEEIVLGAIIGVVSAWLVFPVRSTGVLKRRMADALAVLADALDPATPARPAGDFACSLLEVNEVAPAFRAVRFATRRLRRPQPADWVDLLLACREPASRLIEDRAAPAKVRKLIGASRRALRQPTELLAALTALHDALIAHGSSATQPPAGG